MNEIGTLGDILAQRGGSIKTGPFGTTLKAHEYSRHGVPIISVGEVGYGSLRLRKDTPMAPDEVTSRLPEYLLEAGDIVFGRKGAVDRSAWIRSAEAGWFLGSDGIRLRLPPSVESRFVAYQFQSEEVRTWLLQHASGSTMLSLNQRILERVPLKLPEISEQRAIAEVLGTLDDKIAANTTLADKAATLVELEFRRLMKRAEKSVTLGDLLALEYGKSLPTMRRAPGSVRVYGSGGIIGTHDEALNQGPGVVVGRKGTAGAVHWSPTPFFPIDTTYWVRPLKDYVSPVFAYFLLKSLRLDEMNSDSAVPGLNRNEALATPVLCPPSLELQRFTDEAMELFDVWAQMDQENRRLAATRDTLLPQLMSGKSQIRDIQAVVGTMA